MPLFQFHVEEFGINNTRAVINDTDYVAIGLKVNQNAPLVAAKKVGDVDNGRHNVNIATPLAAIEPGDHLSFGYLIINHGGGSSKDVLAACTSVFTQTSFLTYDPAQAATQGDFPTSLIEGLSTKADMLTLWNEIKGQFSNVSRNRCDGPVVVDRYSIDGFALPGLVAASASEPFGKTYLGTDSAIGCGSNSDYGVAWNVSEVNFDFPVNVRTLSAA